MTNSRVIGRAALTVLSLLTPWACGGDSTAPIAVASVDVTSPVGALLDVGGSAQLTASALDAEGAAVSGVAFTWTSSNSAIVSVSGSGQVQALAVGTATIQAVAGDVGGSLTFTVVQADLAGITTLVVDPYVEALVTGTTSTVRAALEAALTACSGGIEQGNLEKVQSCIADARSEVTAASDPTDRALLAVLALFLDEIERLLNA